MAWDGRSFPDIAETLTIPLPTVTARAKREGWRRRDIVAARLAEAAAAAAAADADGPEPEDGAPATDNAALIAATRLRLAEALAADRAGAVRFYAASLERLERADRTRRGGAPAAPQDGAEAPGPPWAAQAHAGQRPPADGAAGGDWRTWLFMGGRGAGKTRAGAEWLDAWAQAHGGGRMALVGPALHDVREVMVDGPSGLLRLPRAARPRWEASRRRLVWPNEAVAYAFSAEDPESLRGPQHGAAWADEFCVWRGGGDTLALLRMGLRLGARPRLAVTTTPKPQPALRRLIAEPGCVVTRAPTAANAAALPPAFLDDLHEIYGGTRLALQELEGVLLEADEGALWRAAELARTHGPTPARLERVVVAVDPPAGGAEGGSACGIVAAGRLDGRGYVLEDASVRGLSPNGWALRVQAAVRRWGAAAVVAEANQGGDMVRTVLRGAGVNADVELVHARAGKRARAEPVAALYEQGRVTHCAPLGLLEEEMLTLGCEGAARADRADALVWAMTALLLGTPTVEPRLRVL